MFGTVMRHPLKVFSQVARDPLDAFASLQEEILSRFESKEPFSYTPEPNWEPEFRRQLGIPADPGQSEFWTLWNSVVDGLRARGVRL